MKRDIADAEITRARIRALQGVYPRAHSALENWGAWSRDRHGIFPPENPPPSPVYAAIDRSEWDRDGYGEVEEQHVSEARMEAEDRKSERADREEYDEKAGYDLDARINDRSLLPTYLAQLLAVAYARTRETPEDQLPRLAGCTEDTFCERLEACLRFVGRFC